MNNFSLFGIGPLELIFILIIALVVLGPERLPQVARQVLQVLAQARNLYRDLSSQLSTEFGDFTELQELRKDLQDLNAEKLLDAFADDESDDESDNESEKAEEEEKEKPAATDETAAQDISDSTPAETSELAGAPDEVESPEEAEPTLSESDEDRTSEPSAEASEELARSDTEDDPIEDQEDNPAIDDRCHAITRSGSRCKNKARANDTGFCTIHARATGASPTPPHPEAERVDDHWVMKSVSPQTKNGASQIVQVDENPVADSPNNTIAPPDLDNASDKFDGRKAEEDAPLTTEWAESKATENSDLAAEADQGTEPLPESSPKSAEDQA